jgi:hypothetical protein
MEMLLSLARAPIQDFSCRLASSTQRTPSNWKEVLMILYKPNIKLIQKCRYLFSIEESIYIFSSGPELVLVKLLKSIRRYWSRDSPVILTLNLFCTRGHYAAYH